MDDFLIVGAGIIGLSIAWELANRGHRVRIIDRHQPGRATSWAGVGILPPPRTSASHDALEQLRAASHRLHVEWSQRLLDETGIDSQLLKCGGLYVARRTGEATALRAAMQWSSEEGVSLSELSVSQLVELEPVLQSIADEVKVAFYLPDEMQIRPPRHLKALIKACEQRGVVIQSHADVTEVKTRGAAAVADVVANDELLKASQYILCCGPWTATLVEPLGVRLPVEPWRGQVILWKSSTPVVSCVVNEGLRYLVPRSDGQLIVGATVEDVGFDNVTTEEAAIAELVDYSCELVPQLRDDSIVRAWSGLRPKTPDGLPFLGVVPGFDNLSVATGHYRSGLHLAPATAIFMAQLLTGEETLVTAAPFRIQR